MRLPMKVCPLWIMLLLLLPLKVLGTVFQALLLLFLHGGSR